MIETSNENGVFKIKKGEINDIIGYHQNYTPSKDITIVTKEIYFEDGIVSEEIIGVYHGEPNIIHSLECLKSAHPLVAKYVLKTSQKDLTNYEKLIWAEENKADKVRVLLISVYHHCWYGFANTSGDDVFIKYDHQIEGEIVTIEEFNKSFKIIRIIF